MMRVALALAFAMSITTASAQLSVTDGDTIRIGDERIRIVGMNTPEISDAKCVAERSAGILARDVLRELLKEPYRIDRVGHDRYKRTLARVYITHPRLYVFEKDVADLFVEVGLAEPYHCVRNRCPRRRNWCTGE